MRTCYGSHNKHVPREASHRISRDHPERGFLQVSHSTPNFERPADLPADEVFFTQFEMASP